MYVVKVGTSVCIMSALNWLNPKEASILLSCSRLCTLSFKSDERNGYSGTKWNSTVWKDNISWSMEEGSEELERSLQCIDADHKW